MSNLKKVVALALALALVMTMFAGATIKSKLPVVDADQFTEAQLDAAALLKPLGVLAGMGADELGAGTVTRAQMVAFIYRLINGGDNGVQAYYTKTSQYSDVDPEAWYAPYLNWAYAAKVAYGYGATFGPEDPVTGAQAAAMLVRLLGKDASGNDYALKAEANAIALQLDNGIETKGLYENALARGDMFILLANALKTPYVDKVGLTTIAEKYFDLEIVKGAILLGEDAIGANGYSVFAFRVDTLGNVKYFWTDLLCVEEDSTVFEDYGCKYTLLVSKSQDVQGYRRLYAAYEEDQGNYYKVVTGTVDDGKLVFEKDATKTKKQNVFYDDHCFFYVGGKLSTREAFEASYGVANAAQYKLIDNDGDGKYEFAIIERLSLANLKLETITAKVTAVNADGSVVTLTTADGKEYKVTVGEFWDKDLKVVLDNAADINYALGINQLGYAPYAAISDVYYDFGIAGDYLFTISISKDTKFAGSYGIFVSWSTPLTMYKNMPYGLFVNENSEYFWAYVSTVNEAPAAFMAATTLGNSLIYFTDGDASDDVVSFDTAVFWNNNYTYREIFPFIFSADNAAKTDLTVDFPMNVVSKLYGKETVDYSKLAKFGSIYAVFDINPGDPDGDEDPADAIKYWDVKAQAYADVPAATLIDTSANRTLDGFPMANYKDIEGKYVAKIESSDVFYGVEDLDECNGFVFVTDASITVSITGGDDDAFADELQIYRRNGFWHLRAYADIAAMDAESVKILWNGYEIEKNADDEWVINLGDGTDPEEAYNENPEGYRLAELIKGFKDDVFTEKVDAAIAAFVKANDGEEKAIVAYDYRIKIDAGVVFAYGTVVNNANHDTDPRGGRVTDALEARWVAYDVKTFNSDFGLGATGNDTVPFGATFDEMIFTKIGGTYYVKALKISDIDAEHLPYGWLAPNGYELVLFGGFAGGVNTDGWGVKLVTMSKDGIKAETVYTKVGLGGAVAGDVLLVKRDANGAIVELVAVSTDYKDYLSYAGFNFKLSGTGTLIAADRVCGYNFPRDSYGVKDKDGQGDYFEIAVGSGKTIYYVLQATGEGTFDEVFKYTTEYPKDLEGSPVTILTAGNFVFVIIGNK